MWWWLYGIRCGGQLASTLRLLWYIISGEIIYRLSVTVLHICVYRWRKSCRRIASTCSKGRYYISFENFWNAFPYLFNWFECIFESLAKTTLYNTIPNAQTNMRKFSLPLCTFVSMDGSKTVYSPDKIGKHPTRFAYPSYEWYTLYCVFSVISSLFHLHDFVTNNFSWLMFNIHMALVYLTCRSVFFGMTVNEFIWNSSNTHRHVWRWSRA